MQALLTPDQLDPRITQELATKLAPISERPAALTDVPTDSPTALTDAPSALTDSYTPVGLLDQILTANKHSLSLEYKRVKAVRGDQGWEIQGACLLY